jgi:hypothetical protein
VQIHLLLEFRMLLALSIEPCPPLTTKAHLRPHALSTTHDDDTAPPKDAATRFAIDKNLRCVDWFIYEPIDTIKLFDDENGKLIDPEQAHWDTIPLEWPAEKPMRIQLPVGCAASPVCTVAPPCTMRNVLQSIYDFYQTPLTKRDLHDLGITLDQSVRERLREEHPPRRLHLQGSTELFGPPPPAGMRRHPFSCL